MYDAILEIAQGIVKHGWSLSALGTALFVFLKRRRVKKFISKYVPWLAMEPEDVANYEARQIRIESKIDALMSAQEVPWLAEKTHSLRSGEKNSLTSSQEGKSSALTAVVSIQKESITILRGNQKLKTLLQKYSSTKLQALIVATIMNIALLVGYVMDIQDIQSKVDAWMPMANVIIQTVLTIAYQWARASVDKAEITANTPEVSANDAKVLDIVRSNSEGA